MKTVKIIKLRGKLVHKNAVKKSGTARAVNFELKIGTVPLKAGQLVSMTPSDKVNVNCHLHLVHLVLHVNSRPREKFI